MKWRTMQQTHPGSLARLDARTDLSRLIIPGAPRMIIFALLPFQAHTTANFAAGYAVASP